MGPDNTVGPCIYLVNILAEETGGKQENNFQTALSMMLTSYHCSCSGTKEGLWHHLASGGSATLTDCVCLQPSLCPCHILGEPLLSAI